MRMKRLATCICCVGIILSILMGFSISSSASDIIIESNNRLLTNRIESYGTISQIVCRENSAIGPQYNFYPNPLNGRVSVYAQEDPSYGNVLYSVTNQYSLDNIYIPYVQSIKGINGLGVEASFIVYADLGVSSTNSVYNSLWSSLTQGGQQIKINGFNTDIFVADILIERHSGLPDHAYKCTVSLEVDLDAPHNLDLESKFIDGANTIFFQFTSKPVSAYHADNILTMGSFSSRVWIDYVYLDPYGDQEDRPLTPSATESMDNMSDAADDLSSVGGNIGDAADDLESLTPSIGDPFSGAPGAGDYAIGSQFFTSLFNYLYVNDITGAFISFGLIMALIVFIMRR